MTEAICSSETLVITRITRCNIPEGGFLHSHRPENLISYIALTGWALQLRVDVSPVKYGLGQIAGAGLCFRTGERDLPHLLRTTEWDPPEDGDRIQSSKRRVLNKKQDNG
jgi:hypothetical protein